LLFLAVFPLRGEILDLINIRFAAVPEGSGESINTAVAPIDPDAAAGWVKAFENQSDNVLKSLTWFDHGVLKLFKGIACHSLFVRLSRLFQPSIKRFLKQCGIDGV
jgi:hypothetical protein